MNQDKLATQTQEQSNPNNNSKGIWKKPQVQKLRVSLDTAMTPGSNTDGLGGSISIPN